MSSFGKTWRFSPLGLYVGSFLFAFQDSATLLALPWQVLNLGGQTLAVGLAGGLQLMAYMVFCFFVGSVTDRVGVKPMVLFSLTMSFLISLLIPLAPTLWILFALVAIKGVVLSAHWPLIMGWVSSGIEGGSLNKRLGIFNFSWSSGCILGTFLGGYLFAVAYWIPFVVAGAACVLEIFSIMGVQSYSPVRKAIAATMEPERESAELVLFRWIWRIGLVAGWIALGAIRTPIVTLITEMQQDSKLHAGILAGMNLLFTCGFVALSRTVRWHYRFKYVLLAELSVLVILVGIAMSQTPGQLTTFVLVGTPGMAFMYSSHLFYAVSGSRQRQNGAALHEILLSLGISIGSFGGGVWGQAYGIRAVYIAIAGVIGAAILVQAAIFYLLKEKEREPALETVRTPAS